GVATPLWSTNIRGRNTTPRRTMKTMPATMEYRSSFVAWGGGLRLRLKTAVGLRGRAMRIDSLHVDRGTARDGAVALLRRVPAMRIVGAEHLDLHPQFLREEMGILSQHRELVHGAEPIPIFDPCVSQLVRDLLRVRGHLLRPFPYPGLCQGLLHQDVHREGSLGRQASRELVDAELPRWRCVQGDSLRRDPGHLEDLTNVRESRLEEHLCCLGSWIDLVRVRIVEAISRVRDREPDHVRGPVPQRLPDIPGVAARLRHLAPREPHPSIHPVAARPVLLREDRRVVEQAERHVILDEVLARV